MLVKITLIRDDGTTVDEATLTGDAMHPLQYKTRYEVPLEDAEYQLFGWTYQPMIVLKRNR